MKIFTALLMLSFSLFAANESGDYQVERYFPVGWEPPEVINNGNGSIAIRPSVPIFDKPTKLRAYLEVGNTSVQASDKIKEVIFRLVTKKENIRIFIGKVFKLAKKSYKFIGVEKGHYVIQDLKTKKKIVFKKAPPKKKEMKK